MFISTGFMGAFTGKNNHWYCGWSFGYLSFCCDHVCENMFQCTIIQSSHLCTEKVLRTKHNQTDIKDIPFTAYVRN